MALTEIISVPTRRVFWLASYGLDVASRPTLPQTSPFTGTESQLFLKSGSVFTGTQTVTWAGGFICALNPFYTNRYPASIVPFPFVQGSNVLYVDGSSGQVVGAPGSSFPAGSLPLYQFTVDAAGRFQSIVDVRPWTGTFTMETVSNPAYRASYGNSFSFSEVTAQGSGAYAVQVGPGAVSLGVTRYPVGTQGGWVNLTPSAGGNSGAAPNTGYAPGSTVQAYVDSYGNFQTLQVEYPVGRLSGVTSITQFPSGSLPLFIAHLDGIGRIATLDDYRPA